MTSLRCLLLLFACFAVGLAVTLPLGLTYSGRLSSHEGFHLVPVTDVVDPTAPALRRPRRSVLVVLDGLGFEEAQRMRSLARLQERGQCRRTDVGSLPLSRPVYAVLSTGLEQDRTGSRGNDDVVPLAVESVWEVAREAGLTVTAVSELPWWRELFPRGFTTYVTLDRSVDYFAAAPPGDLQLIHPLYIDEVGHESGAGSPEYAAAVARADAELLGFLDTLDLERDLIVVTADHGHSLRGGHGGRQDRVAHVSTCHAGVGVRHLARPEPLRSTAIGPSLALLLGLRFPAHMRAGDDDLDVLWELADPAAFPPGYLDERRRSVDRFRAVNRAQLARWLPASEGSWDRFYRHHRWLQELAALPFVGLLALVFAAQAAAHRRRSRGPGARFGLAFVALFVFTAWAAQVGLRGSFDLSSIANREEFLGFTVALGVTLAVGAIGLHLLARRSLGALLIDLAALSVTGTLLSLAHPAALGWRLGFPVPPPALFFFPYFATIVLGLLNGAGVLAWCVGAALAVRRGALAGWRAPG